MVSSVQKSLSYLLPIKLNSYQTSHNGRLSITLFNGKKLLDTAISNYSFGSLQRILHKALLQLPFDHTAKEILVLGMGAGSVVATIREDLHSGARITLVEIDADVIAIAKNEFGISRFDDITIVHDDAIHFMQNNQPRFDLVIVDLFIIDTIPKACTQPVFLQQLVSALSPGGQLLYNTIDDTFPAKELSALTNELTDIGMEIRILKKIERSNNIVIGKMKSRHSQHEGEI